MVVRINKKIQIIKKKKLNISDEIKNKIDVFWKEQVKRNPHLFNGEVWSVSNFEEVQDRIIITIQKTNYAHYLFDERVGLEGNNGCYNLNCGILLETKDGYYVIGEMADSTSYPRGLQISGGNLDQNDINPDGKVDIINNVSRELKEELNIDLLDSNLVTEYQMKYMEKPQGRRHAYTLMMKGKLMITSSQMKERYKEYKEKLEKDGEDVEFKKIHFIRKANALQELSNLENPKRPYLKDLIDLDSRE